MDGTMAAPTTSGCNAAGKQNRKIMKGFESDFHSLGSFSDELTFGDADFRHCLFIERLKGAQNLEMRGRKLAG